MKNYLTLVLISAVFASPAYASRARIEALGEGKNGSYYIDDSRNMFLSPASIVKYKKKLMLELGGAPATALDGATGVVGGGLGDGAVTASSVDASGNSRAQGGFVDSIGDFTYAIYLNNASDRVLSDIEGLNFHRADGLDDDVVDLLAPSDSIEFALAGEGFMNWGASVFFAGNNNNARSASYFGARLGLTKGDLSAFGTLGLSANSKSAAFEYKGRTSFDLGATYKLSGFTLIGKYSNFGYDSTGDVANANRNSSFGVGVGYKKDLTKSTNLFARVGGDYIKTTNSINSGNLMNVTQWNVPVVLAAETQALSWLTVRGSIGHSLIGGDVTGRRDLTGLTTIGAGLGLTFGDLVIDGLVASNGVNPTNGLGMGSGPAAGGLNGAAVQQGFGLGDSMITRVAMTYNF